MLFVCYGNICRSPYAAAAFERGLDPLLRERLTVDSAGFFGSGRKSPPNAVVVAAGRGIDLEPHRSRLLTEVDLHDYGLVVVMEPVQRRGLFAMMRRRTETEAPPEVAPLVLVLGDLDPMPIATRKILDPVGQSTETFAAVYTRIDRCVEELIRILRSVTERSTG